MTFDDKEDELGGALSDEALDGLSGDDDGADEEESAGAGFDDFGGTEEV